VHLDPTRDHALEHVREPRQGSILFSATNLAKTYLFEASRASGRLIYRPQFGSSALPVQESKRAPAMIRGGRFALSRPVRSLSLPTSVLSLVPAGLTVDQLLPGPERIVLVARPSRDAAPCPSCARPSARRHSAYQRHIADLPWQGRVVELQVQVRRLRCTNLAITHIRGVQAWACAERSGREALSSTDTYGPGARWIVPAGMPPPG
jgi:hypothetical protein